MIGRFPAFGGFSWLISICILVWQLFFPAFDENTVKNESAGTEETQAVQEESHSLSPSEATSFCTFFGALQKALSDEPVSELRNAVLESAKNCFVRVYDLSYLEPGNAYGTLSCERLGVWGQVFWGDSYDIYHYGIGQDMASRPPGFGYMVLLSAHNTTHFEPLVDAEEGDIFVFETPYGTFEYEVAQKRIVNEFDFQDELLENIWKEKEELVLYTCWPNDDYYGHKPDRLVLNCRKVRGPFVYAPWIDFVPSGG